MDENKEKLQTEIVETENNLGKTNETPDDFEKHASSTELQPVDEKSLAKQDKSIEIKEQLKSIRREMSKSASSKQGRAFMRILQFFAIMLVLTIFVKGAAGVTMPLVNAAKPTSAEISKTLSSSGTVKSVNTVQVDLPAGLTVKKIYSSVGTNVDIESKLVEFDMDAAEDELIAQEQKLISLQQELRKLQDDDGIDDSAVKNAKEGVEAKQLIYNEAATAADVAKNALDNATNALNDAITNKNNIQEQGNIDIANAQAVAQAEYDKAKAAANAAEKDKENKESAAKDAKDKSDLDPTNVELTALAEYTKNEYDEAVIAYDNAIDALVAAKAFLEDSTNTMTQRVNDKVAAANAVIDGAQAAKSGAAEIYDETIKTRNSAYSDLEDAQDIYNEAKKAYNDALIDEKLAKQYREYSITLKTKEIAEQEKFIKDMENALDNAGIILAPIAGTVSDMNISEDTPTEKGSYITISTTAEGFIIETQMSQQDSQRLQIGSNIQVEHPWNQWIYLAKVVAKSGVNESGMVTVTASLNERDFTTGTNVNLTVELSNNRYYTTVPLSAIHSDNDGSFVFVLVTEKTILGEQSVARKAKVKINESGNGIADITFEDYGSFYDNEVINASSKPLKDGATVRKSNDV